MSIIQDMDACFLANRPLRRSATWLIGGNVWHAFMADLNRIHRDQGVGDLFDPSRPPTDLYGAKVRRVPRMSGWGLADRLDDDAAEEHSLGQEGVDAHAKSLAE